LTTRRARFIVLAKFRDARTPAGGRVLLPADIGVANTDEELETGKAPQLKGGLILDESAARYSRISIPFVDVVKIWR
jgi:hypothetical protein